MFYGLILLGCGVLCVIGAWAGLSVAEDWPERVVFGVVLAFAAAAIVAGGLLLTS